MLLSSITLGLIFSLVTLGAWLTSRVIAFDDLSIEGSFCLGGALTAKLLILNLPVALTIPVMLLAGSLSGVCTTLMHNMLGINNLLCGILTTNIMFTISLLIATANLPLLSISTLFTPPANISEPCWTIFLLSILVSSSCLFVHWLLSTQVGLLIQTLGSNKSLIVSLGKRPALFEGIAIGLANALAALAGSLFVQTTGFFSIWSSVGVMIIGLAGLMLGQLIGKKLPALVLGSIILQVLITLAFEFNMQPELHKLICALLIIVFTIISRIRKQPC